MRDTALRDLVRRGPGARRVDQTGPRETKMTVYRGGGTMQVVHTIYADAATAAHDVRRQDVSLAR